MKILTQDVASCLNCGAAILTPKEREFFLFLKRYKELPRQSKIARDFGVDRRRVFQLMARLREKGVEVKK